MISKDEFLNAIDAIRTHEMFAYDVYNVCSKHNVNMDYCVFEPSNNLVSVVVDLLTNGMNDTDEYISWWLFDCDFGKYNNTVVVKGDNVDESYDLDSAEKLYDFLVKYNNKD
jgi:hypothetical protein